jgi:hypothetical protein
MNRCVDKNNFGEHTWEMKIEPVFRVYFHGTNNNSFIIELQEFKWFRYKTLWSFTSYSNLEAAICKGYDRLFEYFQEGGEFRWTEAQKNKKIKEALMLYRTSKFFDIKRSTDYSGFQLIEKPGNYLLEILREPELMDWGTSQVHFKAKTPEHFTKSRDYIGTLHETLYLELWCDHDAIDELGSDVNCFVDYYKDLKSGQQILNIVGIGNAS